MKIKTMDTKMAKYLSTTESKQQTKQTRRSESPGYRGRFDGWRGVWGNGRRGEGMKKYKWVVTESPWGREVQCRKCSSQ